MKILVTGAGGFVGKHYLRESASRYELIPVSLRSSKPDEITFAGIDVILHLAVVAHDASKVNDDIQYRVNVDLTRELANRAKQAGVKQFIFMSSVKVYGEGIQETLTELSVCSPVDAYGKSKLEAETYLLAQQTNTFSVAIIRPPVVYGPDVKGNMLRMLQLAGKNIPLPFGNTHNKRSVVYIGNLIALVNHIIDAGSSGVFIAGDSSPVSTKDLFVQIRKAFGVNQNLFSMPSFLQKILKRIKPDVFIRLYGSFEVSNTGTNERLQFTPPVSTAQGIQEMVNWFKNTRSRST